MKITAEKNKINWTKYDWKGREKIYEYEWRQRKKLKWKHLMKIKPFVKCVENWDAVVVYWYINGNWQSEFNGTCEYRFDMTSENYAYKLEVDWLNNEWCTNWFPVIAYDI